MRRRAAKPGPVYVAWPRSVLLRPPVRHRDDAQKLGLTVFEIAVAGACMALAHPTLMAKRHAASMRRGRKAINAERRTKRARDPDRPWLSDEEWQLAREARAARVPDAGSIGYMAGSVRFDSRRGEMNFTFDTSANEVLRTAGLGKNARSIAKLTRTLDRLTKDMRRKPRLPPVLVRWRRLGSGLRLTISGYWLPARAFGRVPWPPPARGGGSRVMAAYLLVHGLDHRPNKHFDVDFEALLERMRVRPADSADATRVLIAAVAAVNRHLQSLGPERLAEHGLPAAYEVVGRGTRIRIVPMEASSTEWDMDEEVSSIESSAEPEERPASADEEALAEMIGLSPRAQTDPRQQQLEWQSAVRERGLRRAR